MLKIEFYGSKGSWLQNKATFNPESWEPKMSKVKFYGCSFGVRGLHNIYGCQPIWVIFEPWEPQNSIFDISGSRLGFFQTWIDSILLLCPLLASSLWRAVSLQSRASYCVSQRLSCCKLYLLSLEYGFHLFNCSYSRSITIDGSVSLCAAGHGSTWCIIGVLPTLPL